MLLIVLSFAMESIAFSNCTQGVVMGVRTCWTMLGINDLIQDAVVAAVTIAIVALDVVPLVDDVLLKSNSFIKRKEKKE
jgi:hypothetical protein